MSKKDRKFKIAVLVISILEITLTPFVSHNALILVCAMGWLNVGILQLVDLLDNKGGKLM